MTTIDLASVRTVLISHLAAVMTLGSDVCAVMVDGSHFSPTEREALKAILEKEKPSGTADAQWATSRCQAVSQVVQINARRRQAEAQAAQAEAAAQALANA